MSATTKSGEDIQLQHCFLINNFNQLKLCEGKLCARPDFFVLANVSTVLILKFINIDCAVKFPYNKSLGIKILI